MGDNNLSCQCSTLSYSFQTIYTILLKTQYNNQDIRKRQFSISHINKLRLTKTYYPRSQQQRLKIRCDPVHYYLHCTISTKRHQKETQTSVSSLNYQKFISLTEKGRERSFISSHSGKLSENAIHTTGT